MVETSHQCGNAAGPAPERGGVSAWCVCAAIGLLLGLSPHAAVAQDTVAMATATSAAVSFGSLKTDRVEVRAAPMLDRPVTLIFRRAGLPVQVLDTKPGWQRVQDAEGTTGWVAADLVSKRRTAMVRANDGGDATAQVPLRAADWSSSGSIALLEPGVIVGVVSCDGRTCKITTSGVRGYVDQPRLWGVGAGEVVR